MNQTHLTADEIAKAARIHKATVYRLARGGHIPGAVRIGNSVRFHRPTIERWLRGEPTETTESTTH